MIIMDDNNKQKNTWVHTILKKNIWEGLFFTEKCQLIKVEGITEFEKHHFATVKVISDSAKIIHGC